MYTVRETVLKDTIKAVVFDCDGVMFDTADANRIYYNRVLANFNKQPLSEEQVVQVRVLKKAPHPDKILQYINKN